MEHGEVLTAGIPDARLLALHGVGHLPRVKRSDDAARVILDFLTETDQPARGGPGAGDRPTD